MSEHRASSDCTARGTLQCTSRSSMPAVASEFVMGARSRAYLQLLWHTDVERRGGNAGALRLSVAR